MEPATAFGPTASCDGYYCGRCGQPKKDHVCHISIGPAECESLVDNAPSPASFSVTRPLPPPPHRPFSNLRPALSLDDDGISYGPPDPYVNSESVSGLGGLPSSCLWDILKRLPPLELLAAAAVCKGWRDTTRRLWKAAEVLRIKVPARAQLGLLGSLLQKCPALVNLSLRMESDVDATLLSWIKSSCPNLESLQISTSETTTNWITGDELGQFVANRRLLKSLKMEGCSNLGGVSLCSSSLCTIWLSGLQCITKMVFNCPNLTEISVDFPGQENDNTDLVAIVNILGRNCPGLQNLRISSIRLSNAVVHALAAAHLRGLRMLSLVLGSEITDASVDAITSSYPNLELLDLSGSSISDRGIEMICNVFRDTLSRLLVALCPNISSSIIQFATAQLPLLQLLDCGMTFCDPNSTDSNFDLTSGRVSPQTSSMKVHMGYQELIIKHGRLKKLSLWGCSSLDALCLNCPELSDLNLNSCRNLHPERLVLWCPKLEKVRASGCQRLLIEAIQSQIDASVAAMTSSYPNLELHDLTGFGPSDSGIGTVCNVFPDTLSRLPAALCSNISSSFTKHGTTTCFLFFNGGVFVAVDTRSTLTPLDEESANRYVVLDVDSDCEDSYEDLNATPDENEEKEKEKEEVKEVDREEVEGDIGVTDKKCVFKNNVLAAFAGNCDRWADATKRVIKMIDIYTHASPLMIANQFKLFLKRSCTLRDSNAIDGDIDVVVVGYDSLIQRVRVFMVTCAKNHMRLIEYTSEDVYSVTGSGDSSVDDYFGRCVKSEYDRLSAFSTIKGAMLHAALRDRGTGGDIKVFEVTSFGTGQVLGESVINLYSQSLLEIENIAEGLLLVHNKTCHKVSNKDIAAKFERLSRTGSVRVSHVLAEVGDYNLRRVVFKNPSDSRKVYYKLNKDFPFQGIDDTRRTQIETHKYIIDCGKRKKVRVMNDVYAGVATVELLAQILRVLGK